MSIECEFCKKFFGSNNILQHHKKTAKYCLDLQGKIVNTFECSYCKKCLTTNERLMTHLNICKSKVKEEASKDFNEQKKYYEEKLKEKDDYIKKLEARLEKFEDSILSKTIKKQEETIPIPLKEKMSSIIIEDIKEDETVNYSMINLNNVNITSRPIDHYVNATQLCQCNSTMSSRWKEV